MNSTELLAYDVWGQRLEENWEGLNAGETYQTEGNSRGFTNHEHLDSVGLIHMNGRAYDPVLGRFISPDPIIQDPYNTQSFNRYSYVWNNPMRYTDPTGYVLIIVGEGGSNGSTFDMAAETFVRENPGNHTTVNVSTGDELVDAINIYASENNGKVDQIEYFGHSGSIGLFVNQQEGEEASIYTDFYSPYYNDPGSAGISDINGSYFDETSTINLNGCSAGDGGSESFAQELSNHTGATVNASTGPTEFSYSSSQLEPIDNNLPSNYQGGIYLVPTYTKQGFQSFSPEE